MLLLPSPVANTRSSWAAENSQPVKRQIHGWCSAIDYCSDGMPGLETVRDHGDVVGAGGEHGQSITAGGISGG